MTKKGILGLMIVLLIISVPCLSSFASETITNESQIVYPTSAKVVVNGTPTEFEAYLIDGSNYLKLRDIAMAINHTNASFSVEWDSTVNVIVLGKGWIYDVEGGELAKGDGKPKQATLSTSPVFSGYEQLKLTSYIINGCSFFKLRDIADAMEFTVTFSTSTNTVVINTTGFYGLSAAEKIKYKEPVNTGIVLKDKVDYSEFVGYYYDGSDVIRISENGIYNIVYKDGIYHVVQDPHESILDKPYKDFNYTKAPYRYGEFGITIMIDKINKCIVEDWETVLVITKNNKGVPCAGLSFPEGYFLRNYEVKYEWFGTSISDLTPFLKKKELEKKLEKTAEEEKEKRIKVAIDKSIAQRQQIIDQKVNSLNRNNPVTAANFLQGRFVSEKTNSVLQIGYWIPDDIRLSGYDRYDLKVTKLDITYRYGNGNYNYMGVASMTVTGDVTTLWIDDDDYVILTAEYGSSITYIKLMIDGVLKLNGPIDYKYVDNNVE